MVFGDAFGLTAVQNLRRQLRTRTLTSFAETVDAGKDLLRVDGDVGDGKLLKTV